MRDSAVRFAEAARPLVEHKLMELAQLSYDEARQLPEVAGDDLRVAGMKASLTVFRQDDAYQLRGKTLVVVLAARPTMLGMGAQHVERGLVFSRSEPTREATETELRNSGG